MGTDIHLQTEIRIHGRWQPLREKATTKYSETPEYSREFGDRNYDLFAILANVRNGAGFAGVVTGDGFEVKYPPRGLPDDLSGEFKADHDERGTFGDHSFSHLTFSEVLALPFHKVSRKTGWVSWKEYAKWRFKSQWEGGPHNNGPESWSGGVSGGAVSHVPESVFRERFDALSMDEQRALWVASTEDCSVGGEYTQIEWTVTYAYVARGFFSAYFLPTLAEAAERGCGPESVRMVFGFDS